MAHAKLTGTTPGPSNTDPDGTELFLLIGMLLLLLIAALIFTL